MRLLLAHVPHRAGSRSATPHMAAGLTRIALAARRAGHDVALCNGFTLDPRGESWTLAGSVRSHEPDVLGLSLQWTLQLEETLGALESLAGGLRPPRTVLGGLTAESFAQELRAAFPWVEVAGSARAETLDWTGEPVPDRRAELLDLDDPVVAEAELAQARAAGFWSREPAGPIRVLSPSSGCLRTCPLCGGASAAARAPYWRAPAGAVVRAMERDLERGFAGHYLCCDPSPRRPFLEPLLARLCERAFPGQVSVALYTARDQGATERFLALPRPGLVEISPESGDEEVRRAAKAPSLFFTNAELLGLLDRLVRAGVETQLYFSYFLPFDDPGTVERTAAFLFELGERHGGRVRAYYLPATTDPGSCAFLDPGSLGLQGLDRDLGGLRRCIRRYQQAGSTANPLTSLPAGLAPEDAWHLASVVEIFEAGRRARFHGGRGGTGSFRAHWCAARRAADAAGGGRDTYIRLTRREEATAAASATDFPA